jgi:WYL domain
MPPGTNDALIRERIIGLATGGQSFIEMIRFAAANRLLVDIDYRDKKGVRSTRAIEAYSLRRSQAGDILLMAARADSGQPRSYLVSNILGVSPTQTSFTPRYPIELTPSGPQFIPDTSRSAGMTTSRLARVTRRLASSGPTYVHRCTACRKFFERKTHDTTLRRHKNPAGWQCYGTYGTYVRTKY